ncbi:hypothetical protein MRX96_008356 [Rhipicephalus microplus]
MLNSLIGTRGVFNSALNAATESSRVFFLGEGGTSDGRDSHGLSCIGDDVASAKRFGRGASKVKYSFKDATAIGSQMKWIRFYFVSPSGMLSEGTATATGYAGGTWPHMNSYTCDAYSVVVSEADYELRMARALELIEQGVPSVTPRNECTMSYWLSGNPMLLAGATWGAYLSFGLHWAILNGLLTPSSGLTSSIKMLLLLVTNGRVANCIDFKRRLYKDGSCWAGYADVTKNALTDGVARRLLDVQGFPLRTFIIRAVLGKLGL